LALLESDLQCAVFRWARTRPEPELEWLYAVPNGEKRNPATARRLKDQGVKAGILDIALDVARHGYHGWRCELKRPDGKVPKPSKEQAAYMAFLTEQGYFVLLSNDFDEVKASLLWYLGSN